MKTEVSVVKDVISGNIYGFVVHDDHSVKAVSCHTDSEAWAAWVNDSRASFDETKESLDQNLQHEFPVAADLNFLNEIYGKVDNKVFSNLRSSLSSHSDKNIFYSPISDFSDDQKQLAIDYKAQFFSTRQNVVALNIQGKAARAIYDRNIGPGGGWRCPDGTLYGGQITDRFGRGCGGSLTRRIGRAIAGAGRTLEDAAKPREQRRMSRRADRQTARSRRRAARRERRASRRDETSAVAATPVVADEILMADFPREQTSGDRTRKRRAVVEEQLSFFDDNAAEAVVPVGETSESEVLVKPTEPRKPYEPVPPPLSGRAQEIADEVGGDWEKFKEKINEEGFVVFDYETTGFIGATNKPTQIGAVRIKDGEIVERFNIFVNPGEPLSDWSKKNLKDADGNPLTDEYLANQMSLEEGHKQLAEFLKDSIIAAHNLPFDEKILREQFDEAGIEFTSKGSIDTLQLARDVIPSAKDGGEGTPSHGLEALAKFLGLEFEGWHRADVDAEVANEILQRGIDYAVKNNVEPKALDAAYQAERFAKDNEKYQAQLPVYQEAYEKFKNDLDAYENARQRGADLPPSEIATSGSSTAAATTDTASDAVTDATPSPKQRRQSRRERKAGKRKPKTETQESAPTQETPDSGSDSDVDFVEIDASGDVQKQLVDAINSGKRVRFHYRGKNRDLKPKEIWTNPKNGNINLKAADSEGYEKDYTISKISNSLPESEAKRRELEKVFEDLGYVYVDFEATGRQVLIDPETNEIIAEAYVVDSVVDFVDEIEDTLDDAIISSDLDEEEFYFTDEGLIDIAEEILPDYIVRLNELDEDLARILEQDEDIPSPPDPDADPTPAPRPRPRIPVDPSVVLPDEDPENIRRETKRGRRLARRLQRDLKKQEKDLKKKEKKRKRELNAAEYRRVMGQYFQDILQTYLEDRAFKKLPPQVQRDMIRQARKAANSAARARNRALEEEEEIPRPRPRIPLDPDADPTPTPTPRPRIPIDPLPDPDADETPTPRPRPRIPLDPDADPTPAPRPRPDRKPKPEQPDRKPKYNPLNETNEEKKVREELEKLEKDEAEKNDFNKPPTETEKSDANKLNLGLEALRDLRKASDLELGRVREKLKKDITSLLRGMNRTGQTPEQIRENEEKLNTLLFNLEDVRHEILTRTVRGVWLKKKDKDTTPKPKQKPVKESKEAFENRIVKDAERDVYPLDALANNELEKDLNRLQTDRDRIEKEAFILTDEERKANPETARFNDDLRKKLLDSYDKRINEVKSEMRKKEKDEPGSFPNINLDDPDPVTPPARKPRKKAAPKKKTPDKKETEDQKIVEPDVDDQTVEPLDQPIPPKKPTPRKKAAPQKRTPDKEEESEERMDYPPQGFPEKLNNSQQTRYARFYNENDELNDRGRYVNSTVQRAREASRRRYTVAERENIAADAERQYEVINPSEPRLAPQGRRNVDTPTPEREREERRLARQKERRRREQEAEKRSTEEASQEVEEQETEEQQKPVRKKAAPKKKADAEKLPEKDDQEEERQKRVERAAEERARRAKRREQLEDLEKEEQEERRKRRAERRQQLEEKPQPEPKPEVRKFDEKEERAKYDLIAEDEDAKKPDSFQAKDNENSYLIEIVAGEWRPYVDGELLGTFKTQEEARKKYDERVAELVEQRRKEFEKNVDKPDSDVKKPVTTKKAPPKKDTPRKARAKKAAPKKETEEKKTSDAEPYRSPLATSSAMASNEEVKKAIAEFDALPDDQLVVVYHGTTSENAEKIRESGVSGFDPRGDDVSAVSQGRGMYVAATAEDAEMYVGRSGGEVIAVTVPKSSLTVSPEMTTDGATVGYALYNPSAGAVIPDGAPLMGYADFEKVDIPEKLVDAPSTPSQQAINRFPLRGLPNQFREPTPNDAWRQRFYDTEGNLNDRGKFVNDFIRSEREKTSRKLSQSEIDSLAEDAEDNFDAINRGIADIPVRRDVEDKPLASQAPPRVVGEPLIGGQQPRRSARKAVATKVGTITKRIQERRKTHPQSGRAGFRALERKLPNGLSYQQSSKGSYADRVDKTLRRQQRVRNIFDIFQKDFIQDHDIEIDETLFNAALDGDIDEETLVAALDSAASMIEITGVAPDVLFWDTTDDEKSAYAYVNHGDRAGKTVLQLTLSPEGFSNNKRGERFEQTSMNIGTGLLAGDDFAGYKGSWLAVTDLDPWQSIMIHEWGHLVQARLMEEDPEAFLDIASQIVEVMDGFGLVDERKISFEYRMLAWEVGKSPVSRDFWMNEGRERWLANAAVRKAEGKVNAWIDNPFGTRDGDIDTSRTSILKNARILSEYGTVNSNELFAELFAMSFSGPSNIENRKNRQIQETLSEFLRDVYQQKRTELNRKIKRKNAAKKRVPIKKATAEPVTYPNYSPEYM